MKTMTFIRHFIGFNGGHLKMFDYFNHILHGLPQRGRPDPKRQTARPSNRDLWPDAVKTPPGRGSPGMRAGSPLPGGSPCQC
ncbi:hypothetical protein [Aurantimonas sp. VKM B-3413]|uniref:hypothetical protein n=1 Tax=Aurantimonas sp. VKM B-3413 TaxID=2779401 RepID=UPI001E5A610E|nr:hypothetical protein [Aurantimonas sp. VKM B-3413]MCB8838664.1 hypothetical protein [Aurantimonas sp. VKM B-3413]